MNKSRSLITEDVLNNRRNTVQTNTMKNKFVMSESSYISNDTKEMDNNMVNKVGGPSDGDPPDFGKLKSDVEYIRRDLDRMSGNFDLMSSALGKVKEDLASIDTKLAVMNERINICATKEDLSSILEKKFDKYATKEGVKTDIYNAFRDFENKALKWLAAAVLLPIFINNLRPIIDFLTRHAT